ncbi:MAG: hypothetical protein GC171_08200 [Terrimonas sp.]|nr:hypothetical protein [Terrimonas sp.]
MTTTTFLLLYFVIAASVSFLINYLLLKFSFNLGSRNNLAFKQVRWSAHVKPSVGGISFFIVFLISIAIIGLIPKEQSFVMDKQMIGIMAASTLGFLMGLADDAYNTNPLIKFLMQVLCAVILLACGIQTHISNIGIINILFTIIWVVGLMNSINMLDNMDAITGSISAMIILGLITVILFSGNVSGNLYLFMLIGVLGSIIGFLYFNWSPSKIYMGDTGSQFLGVFLASTSILYFWQFNDGNQGVFQIKPFIIPALFFIVPLIDTTTVTIRRLMKKQSPFVGGKDHITHHLAYLGLKDRQVVYTLIGTTVLSFPIAVLLILNIIPWNYVVSFSILGYVVALFLVFQLLYLKGARKHKLRQKEERAIPKITKETAASYNYKVEKIPVNS